MGTGREEFVEDEMLCYVFIIPQVYYSERS